MSSPSSPSTRTSTASPASCSRRYGSDAMPFPTGSSPTLDERDQTRALVRTFLARFFENEITQGLDDLKALFFWLLPLLGVPNFLYPIGQMFRWNLVARLRGPEVLRVMTEGEK